MRLLLGSLAWLVLSCNLLAAAPISRERPGTAAQKAAMEKLSFLVGTWRGDGTVTLGDGTAIKLEQTEEVGFKLGGLLLQIEGTGRDTSGKVLFAAMAIVSFDAATQEYRIRAWNDGNYVETSLQVARDRFEWGFQRGPMTVRSVVSMDSKGRWSEISEAVLGDGRKAHSVQMLLSRKP